MEKIFESERIYFCKISTDYLDDYIKMINNPNVARAISHHPMQVTPESEMTWIKEKQATEATIFTMINKETGSFIGNIEIMNIQDNAAEIGICITEDMQDKHFGTEAMKAIVDYGYNVLGIETIYLNVFNFNKRAIKCYQNVGFEIDGPGKEKDDIHMTHRREI